MWPAMQRESEPPRSLFPCGQEHAVTAKVVKAKAARLQLAKHPRETAPTEELSGEQVMALECRVVAGRTRSID